MEEKKRILSIDALRGFDMMWIAGVDKVLKRAGAAMNNDFGAAMAAQMKHVDWAGLHIIDLVFPTFVFLDRQYPREVQRNGYGSKY